MKALFTRSRSVVALFFVAAAMLASCKKDTVKPGPEPVEKPATLSKGTVDGKSFEVKADAITNIYYADAGDAVNSNLTTINLDATGRKMSFFINDLKPGTISLTKKAGTSFAPGNPHLKINATGTSPVVQTYVTYFDAGNSYYAYSGSIKITIDEEGTVVVTWDISFKDASGRGFTSSGTYTVTKYTTVTKSKTEITDPTPIAATPTIENIAPTFGRAKDTIAITGTNYSQSVADNEVMINGVKATVVSATATQLKVIAPDNGTTGNVSVKVKNSEVKTGPTFTYVPVATLTAIAPSHGKSGDVVTFTGTNLSATAIENVVKFNGKSAVVKSAGATQLTVEVPQDVTTGNITITVKGYPVTAATGLDNKFTVDVITTPPVNVGVKGMASRISDGPFSPGINAVDKEGNLYVVDENQQLVKISYNGEVLKSFTKQDFSFKALLSYKTIGLTSDKDGNIHALMYLSLWPNGDAETHMVSISTAGKATSEFKTVFYDQSVTGMEITSTGDYYVLSELYNTPDILKIKADGTVEKFLKGGDGGNFDGRGAYGMDIDGSDNLYVLAYKKGQFTTSVPTEQAIYKFDKAKVKSTVLASYTDGYQDGALATAQFKDMRGIAVDNLDLYVGDNGNFRIRKIALRTGQVTTIGGNGSQYTNGIPSYDGANLSVNTRGTWGLLLDNKHSVIYNFRQSVQKFVY